MDKLEIIGGKKIQGSINVSGSKNASLPILAATLLLDKVRLHNIPLVKDIDTMLDLLSSLGSKINLNKKKNMLIFQIQKKIKQLHIIN